MDIALIAPSPVPFVVGGAENLFWGLQRFLNDETPHHCELFKLATAEGNVPQLVDSYRRFLDLDVSYFDQVISTKYPAWMVQHPRHTVYVQHKLRGLYDTYALTGLPTEVRARDEAQRQWQALMQRMPHPGHPLGPWMDEVQVFLNRPDAPSDLLAFPGPWVRQWLHAVDAWALSPQHIQRHAAISQTVAQRADYFPAGVSVQVAHHPPKLEGFFCAKSEFFFTASRLDSAKRLDLLVRAMRRTKTRIPLKIAGEGPQLAHLQALADGDPRIEFLGKLTDREMLAHYANALAVPFMPYEEDYGLITIEAMHSGKPVLTVSDAGGVLEFVRDGETGCVCPPDAPAIAQALDRLAADPAWAARMGEAARARVAHISWPHVARTLLGDAVLPPSAKVFLPGHHPSPPAREGGLSRRPHWTAVSTFPVYPLRGGGQLRTFELYREWAREADITLLSISPSHLPATERELAPGLMEISIPRTSGQDQRENEIAREVDGVPISDILAAELMDETPAYTDALRKLLARSDALILTQPYLVDVALPLLPPRMPVLYESHNLEWRLKQDILPDNEAGQRLLQRVREMEKRALQCADVVTVCSPAELPAMRALCPDMRAPMIDVPNGFSAAGTMPVTPTLRAHMKRRLGLAQHPCALLIGSWHGPNIEAAQAVLASAHHCPQVQFLVLGSVGLFFRGQPCPANVHLLGEVDEDEKRVAFLAADVALNPMVSGAGSNLKILDYMAHRLPVISTPFGARGFDLSPGIHYQPMHDLADLVPALTRFLALCPHEEREAMAQRAALHVTTRYEWRALARQALPALRAALTNPSQA
jgi:glycosyltransferase involved in cell wall biosynthesis